MMRVLFISRSAMSWLATNLISIFLLPPLNLLLPGLAGLLLWRKRPRAARALLGTSLALLWLLSTPFVAEFLLHSLEGNPQTPAIAPSTPAAIIVLGGGTYFRAPEYGGDTVSETSLQRLRYAARLHREMALPILVSGGKPLGNTLSEAEQMQHVLEDEFKIPVQWVEGQSGNTAENARDSFKLLQPAGITHIYLVTHAWHMPRAARAFRAAGFTVTPAPTAYTTRYQTSLLSFLPRATALRDSAIFMHEAIGLLWYRLKSAS